MYISADAWGEFREAKPRDLVAKLPRRPVQPDKECPSIAVPIDREDGISKTPGRFARTDEIPKLDTHRSQIVGKEYPIIICRDRQSVRTRAPPVILRAAGRKSSDREVLRLRDGERKSVSSEIPAVRCRVKQPKTQLGRADSPGSPSI